ncbi:MAG: DUF1674 domain-containing protein [Luteibacter sp.]|jgi:hypothetical protein|uniref:DUF1674 domain-containing protein n=1 Tax=unclassified Luteibacter TaxID=2620188 RepID=UPI0009DD30CA|nr:MULTISPECIES: DUF1674 domain-containing protein [unclassified Luteibacter]MDQ7994805.1 DUF1674 domain-containing protein [Luteibacter sp.]MDQ8049866.1 DUF1674 domain-containing protein [Luteibacter sp.]MDR6641341.1 hypothetical protein [Luteibacter sp. 1214]
MSDNPSKSEGPNDSAPAKPLVPPLVPTNGEPKVEKAPLDPTRYGDWEKNGRCIDF